MSEGPTAGPAPQGLSERGWRIASMAIWAGVVAVVVFALALIALSWRDIRIPSLGSGFGPPDLALPEVTIPDLGTFRLEADEPETPARPTKPSGMPDGMERADDIPNAEPVDADRLAD